MLLRRDFPNASILIIQQRGGLHKIRAFQKSVILSGLWRSPNLGQNMFDKAQ